MLVPTFYFVVMKCLHPIKIKDKHGNLMNVPCGKCTTCLSNKRSEMAFRVQSEIKPHTVCVFCTLTYDDDALETDVIKKDGSPFSGRLPSVNYDTAVKFVKRLRRSLEPTKLMLYLTAEYGDTSKRPHYHALIWIRDVNYNKDGSETPNPPSNLNALCDAIRKNWTFGYVSIDGVSAASINYVAKHQAKKCQGTDEQAPIFHIQSQGIGRPYLDKKKLIL